ncbi:EcsC family protein [Paenibacillus chartarius]|uniref:EcsC family protein n=1 Tax=Paenibacillus chartarius TaxID=747481 RepID=A0ABV6DED8_9BACL
MTESREALLQELQTITKWEKEQKDLWFWEKLGRLPFMLLDRLTPRIVQDKIGAALDEIGKFLQNGGDYLVSERAIVRRLEKAAGEATGEHVELSLTRNNRTNDTESDETSQAEDGGHVEDPANAEIQTLSRTVALRELPLAVMDKVADDLGSSRTDIATVQGATTGFGGMFTLAVDIPALLGLSLKVLQETAICYGFDPKEERERKFIVKCLQFASSDIVGKKAILEELADYDNPHKNVQVMSQLQGWREVAAAYRDSYGWKKLFQLVPIAGAVFGAFSNRESLAQVAEAGKMLYRKRRIMERLQLH